MDTKTCTKCNISKDLSFFSKDKQKSDGLASWCKKCRSSNKKAHYLLNKEDINEKNRNWHIANKAKIKRHSANYYRNNKDVILKKAKAYREKNDILIKKIKHKYYERNKDKIKQNVRRYKAANPYIRIASTATRRARKKKATPAWADISFINGLYSFSALLYKLTGVKYHVDHIVPLRGENVCGLHTGENLQIITAEENMKKGNKWID